MFYEVGSDALYSMFFLMLFGLLGSRGPRECVESGPTWLYIRDAARVMGTNKMGLLGFVIKSMHSWVRVDLHVISFCIPNIDRATTKQIPNREYM